MANFNIFGNSSTAQTLNSSEEGFIGVNGSLVVTGADAVTGSGYASLTVLGALVSNGIFSSGNAFDHDGFIAWVTVGAAGHLSAYNDTLNLTVSQRVTIHNNGAISSSEGDAIHMANTDSFFTNFEILNNGSITGTISAMDINKQDGNVSIVNSGVISGRAYGIDARDVEDTNNTVIFNSGVIMGGTGEVFINSINRAYVGNDGQQAIYNTGEILGGITYGAANDIYDGDGGVLTGPLAAGDGADTLLGGAFSENFSGEGGDDLIEGRGGDDDLSGGNGVDTVRGGDGDDIISGGGGGDILAGGAGADEINGGGGADLIKGGAGDDALSGSTGDDMLRGHKGDDVLKGAGGDDTLNGGRGDDTLTGGGNADIFTFKRAAGDDLITDFKDGTDLIDISAFGIRGNQFNAVVTPALTNAGNSSTLLDLDVLGGEGSVLIEGLAFSNADASDFIL